MFTPADITDDYYANVGNAVNKGVTCTDANATDTLTVTSGVLPAFLTWDGTTLKNTTAIDVTKAGEHTIALTCCDNWNACVTESFKITVN